MPRMKLHVPFSETLRFKLAELSLITKPIRKRLWIVGKTHKKVLIPTVFGLLVVSVGFAIQDEEKTTVLSGSGRPDFSNAPILGNPHKEILEGEESLFAKNTKDVIEGQKILQEEIQSLRAEISNLKNGGVTSPEAVVPEAPSALPPITIAPAQTPPVDSVVISQSAPSFSNSFSIPREPKKPQGPKVLSFPVQSTGKAYLNSPGIKLPTGSYVKAAILTGVEAPEGRTYPVLLQLDFAHILPNDKRLDLSGCFMIAKATGDLSTERVQMQAQKLSCVSKRGGMFEREVNGFIADDVDNSFAVIGKVNSKQDRVAATAFLSSIVSGIGKAIQQAQTTSSMSPLGATQSNVTGNQASYIAAGGASEAASQVTQWYLKQAQNLLPTINVGSGQNVWVVLQDSVSLPKDYFIQNNQTQTQNQGDKNESIYSHFTRISADAQ